MCSTQRNARESPLLRLPAEIRNLIYEYILTKGAYTFGRLYEPQKPCPTKPRKKFRSWGVLQKIFPGSNANSLLRVCRQIPFETSLLPFELNDFRFQNMVIIKRLIDEHFSPCHRAAMKRIRLRVMQDLAPFATMPSHYNLQHLEQLLPNVERVIIETPEVCIFPGPYTLPSLEQGCTDENKQWLWSWANHGSNRTVQVAFKVVF